MNEVNQHLCAQSSLCVSGYIQREVNIKSIIIVSAKAMLASLLPCPVENNT